MECIAGDKMHGRRGAGCARRESVRFGYVRARGMAGRRRAVLIHTSAARDDGGAWARKPAATRSTQTALMRRTAGALRIGIGGDANTGTARGSRDDCRWPCSPFARWRCERCWYGAGAGDGAWYDVGAYGWACCPGYDDGGGGDISPGVGRLDDIGQ